MSVLKLIGLLEKVEQYLGQHSFKDAKVLAYLFQSEHSVIYYQSIIKDMNISAVSATRSLKLLSESDIITISMDNEDTRKKSVSLTDKGNELKAYVIEIFSNKN